MIKLLQKVKQVNLIDLSVILMLIAMFVIGKICSDSYKGTAENFVLLDWWNMGMYGNLKYILYDIVFIILIYKHRRWLLLVYGFYTLFSIKDFIQFHIDLNIDSLPDNYIIFFIGLILIALFHFTKHNIMRNDNPADGGTEQPHPPPKPD